MALARESDALREWRERRAALRPVPPSPLRAGGPATPDAPQEWRQRQQGLRPLPPATQGFSTPHAGERPGREGAAEGEPQPRIRYRLPDGRYMTEEDIEQHRYCPPPVVPKVRLSYLSPI